MSMDISISLPNEPEPDPDYARCSVCKQDFAIEGSRGTSVLRMVNHLIVEHPKEWEQAMAEAEKDAEAARQEVRDYDTEQGKRSKP